MAQASAAVHALLEPVVTGLGYELLGVEHLAQGGRAILRVYIDSPAGIRVEDCERVSRQVSGVLDVEDPIPGAYYLEVSSPGLDRPLFGEGDFARFAGHRAKVRLRAPSAGQRNFKGVIAGVEDNSVVMRVEGREVRLPLEQIDKANLIPEV
jgi:ribosome maturation factor RimP